MNVRTRAVILTRAHTRAHITVAADTLTDIHLLQMLGVFLITYRNGLPVRVNHSPSLFLCVSPVWQDLSHVNRIFDGVRISEILLDLLAFSSPFCCFHLR